VLRYLETFFRNRWRITIPALILLFSGASIILTIVPTYWVKATIWTEQSPYLDQPDDNRYLTPAQVQTNRFKELVSTNTFSRAIVERISLPPETTEAQKGRLASVIRRGIQIGALGEHSVHVGFTHADPALATAIVQVAVEEYNRVTAESATFQASEAIKFYRERVQTYEATVLPESGGAVTEYLRMHPELAVSTQSKTTDPHLAQLQQQAERDRSEYERYLRRLDEVMVQSQAAERNQQVAFRVLDPPEVQPDTGTLSKKTLVLYAGAATGISFGYVVLFLILATELDQTIRNAGDIRRGLQIPVLEIVPDYSQSKGRSGKRLRLWGRREEPIGPRAHSMPSTGS